jgi:cell division protein FtsN
MVSFFALLDEQKARDLAQTIKVHNENARVLAYTRDGQTIYRVVLGPYATKDDADRVGRDSRQSYWVYEATP